MHTFKIAFLLFITSITTFAQVPTGGINGITNPLTSSFWYDETNQGGKSNIAVSGQSFNEAIETRIVVQPANVWNAQLIFSTNAGISEGDVLLFVFWAKTTLSSVETGQSTVNVVVENKTTYDKQLNKSISIGTEWKQYYAAFKASASLPSSNLGVAFQLGFTRQTTQFADIQLLNFKNTRTLAEMPNTPVDYEGRALNATWRITADQRIDQYRKGDLQVIVKDKNGVLVPSANVTFKMKKHAYLFGTAVDGNEFLTNAGYKDTVLKLFNHVVLENDLKWPFWISWSRNSADEALNQLNQLEIPVRGHVMIWPSWRNSPTYLNQYANNPNQLRTEINNHIQTIGSTYSGKLIDWDVLNEPYDNFDFMNILGRNEMGEWFKRARSSDPTAKLYINDYGILSGGGINKIKQDAYISTIKLIADTLNAPLQGIGFQGHFSDQLTPITLIYDITDRFAALGKELKITEFDIDTDDELVQADFTRDLMTIWFSHPSTKSFLMWGFWEGRHWRPKAAMYRRDWSAKPNLSAYKSNVFDKWWTKTTTVATDNNGIMNQRVFLGDYELKATFGDKTTTKNFSVSQNNQTNQIELVLDLAITALSDVTKLEQIDIYPNPSLGGFMLDRQSDVTAVLEVINLNGQVIDRQNVGLKTNFGHQLSSGLYLVRVITQNGQVFVKKVEKK